MYICNNNSNHALNVSVSNIVTNQHVSIEYGVNYKIVDHVSADHVSIWTLTLDILRYQVYITIISPVCPSCMWPAAM